MNIEQLNELSIFALREIARNVGVASPTSKVKSVLIHEIIEIANGKQKPVQSNGKGRPPKTSKFIVEDILNIFPQEQNSKNILFKQDVICDDEKELFFVEGYVELLNQSVAFLWINNHGKFSKYYIPTDYTIKLCLKTGDFVTANAFMQENQIMINELFTVNDVAVKNCSQKRVDFEEMPYIFPSNLIQFNNESLNSEHLMFGESVYLYGENNNLNTKKLIEMLNSCNADVKIYLNISVAEKNKCLIDMLKGVEVLTSNITEDSDYALKVAVMAMERAKRMAEIGKKVILAVDDVLSLVGSENGDMHVSKQIMSLTKNTSNGSVSVFAIMSENKNVCVFEKLADKRLYI